MRDSVTDGLDLQMTTSAVVGGLGGAESGSDSTFPGSLEEVALLSEVVMEEKALSHVSVGLVR